MNKLVLLLLLFPLAASAQHVSTTDVNNFWLAKDSISLSSDTAKQAALIRNLYLEKASDGLKAFMRNKENIEQRYVNLLNTAPGFWDSLRMKAKHLDKDARKLEGYIGEFKKIYPQLKPAATYFLIGLRQQGGTIRGNLSIIGVEVVLNSAGINQKELMRMGIHEYVHTQQKRPDFQKINVLTSAIREGACDFIAEQVTHIVCSSAYMQYGNKHEAEVWQLFEKNMFTQQNDNWVSTGNNPTLPAPDLGYFVGYKICKTYYDKAPDKKEAIKNIIELDYADTKAVNDFFAQSGYNGR